MGSDATIPVRSATTLCGHVVTRILVPDQTFLAKGPGERAVVLKALDSECMLRDSLHPSVRDRLGRVRELAHPHVANLFGVEREQNDVYLIWEYIEGVTFDVY